MNKNWVEQILENKKNSQAAIRFLGTKTSFVDLPATGNEIGDMWNVLEAHGDVPAGTNYAWGGSAWDALGGTFDTSSLATKTQLNEHNDDPTAHEAAFDKFTLQNAFDNTPTLPDGYRNISTGSSGFSIRKNYDIGSVNALEISEGRALFRAFKGSRLRRVGFSANTNSPIFEVADYNGASILNRTTFAWDDAQSAFKISDTNNLYIKFPKTSGTIARIEDIPEPQTIPAATYNISGTIKLGGLGAALPPLTGQFYAGLSVNAEGQAGIAQASTTRSGVVRVDALQLSEYNYAKVALDANGVAGIIAANKTQLGVVKIAENLQDPLSHAVPNATQVQTAFALLQNTISELTARVAALEAAQNP